MRQKHENTLRYGVKHYPSREANKQAMDLTRNSTQDTALDVLILATPPGAADDIERAIKVGRLVHDLWTLRAKILGIGMTLD